MDSVNTTLEQPQYTAETDSLGYGQILSIVLRRWPWVASALGLSLIGAFLVDLRTQPIYSSSMQLIVEPNFESRLDLEALSSPTSSGMSDVDYATQLNVMRSQRFLTETVERLQAEYPDLNIKTVEKDFRLSQVLENDTETRIFRASFEAPDPILAKRFLEELRSVYLGFNDTQQRQRLSRGLDYINRQLASTQASLQASQAALEQFRQDATIIDPSTQAQQVVEALSAIAREKQQLEADLAEARSRYQVLQQQLQLEPDTALLASRLSQSSQIQALLSELQTTELALAERQVIFTEADPTVGLLLEQRQNQLQLLQRTINALSSTASGDDSLAGDVFLQLGDTDLALISELLLSNTQLQGLSARLSQVSQSEQELRDRLRVYPSLIAEYDRLQPEVDIERETLQRLLQEREQLTSELAKGGYVWQVIEEPELGTDISPSLSRRLALGIVCGLLFGGVIAFIGESVDTRVRSTEDIKRHVPFPILGALPSVKASVNSVKAPRNLIHRLLGNGFNPIHLSEQQPYDPNDLTTTPLVCPLFDTAFRESIDIIADRLVQKHIRNRCDVIAITSGLSGEGKTTVTLGLAYSLARMSSRVLIIDADLRQSGLRQRLDNHSQEGLSTYLPASSSSKEDVIPYQSITVGAVEINLLPAGPLTSDPLLLLSSPRFRQLITHCRQHHDVVLIDTPAAIGIADANKISSACDGLVLVAHLSHINQSELNIVVAMLSSSNVLGVISNGEKNISTQYDSRRLDSELSQDYMLN